MKDRPKVGLALGSGSARGFAHIGVLKVLKENNIPIDYVSGTSIGAVIGALYCSNADLDMVSKLLGCLKTKHLIDLSVSRRGMILGNKIEELLRLFIKADNFEELSVPLSVVATDLSLGERVVFTQGDIINAVRASISIPGIFTPVNYNGQLLVDGGLIDRVPASIVKEMGADIVIGVDVGFRLGDDYRPKNIFDIIIQSIGIMETQIVKRKIEKCDILISPEVRELSPYSLEQAHECIEGGINATNECIDKIKELIR